MSEETKQKIIEGARKSLLKEGHKLSTIKVIAGYAGVNQGLVHHYFGSKEGLMSVLMERQAQQVLHLLFRDHPDWLEELTQGRRPKGIAKMNQKELVQFMRTRMDQFIIAYGDFAKLHIEFLGMSYLF